MKKLLLVLSMSLIAMSYSYGYSNSVDIFLPADAPTYGGSETAYANIGTYCEIQFSVTAHTSHSYAGSYGRAYVVNGGTTVSDVTFNRYANDPSSFYYSSTHTGQWYQLYMRLQAGNYMAHASIRW